MEKQHTVLDFKNTLFAQGFKMIYFFESSVDSDQLASSEASWSGSTLFSYHTTNPYK